MAYVAPGAALGSGMEDFMMRRAQEQRQAMLDQILQQREVRAQQEQMSLEEDRRAGMKLRQDAAVEATNEKERKKTIDEVSSLVPGVDIPDAGLLARAKRDRVPLKVGTPVFSAPEPIVPNALANPDNPPAEVPPVAQATGPIRPGIYQGTPAQQKDTKIDTDAATYIATHDASDPVRKALEFNRLSKGDNLPAGAFQGDKTSGVFRQNTKNGTVDRLVDGQWQTWTGDVPQGAHWMTEPQPKDTSVSDAINADRDARQVQAVREHAYQEFGDMSKNLEAGMRDFDRLGTLLNQHTAQADADAAIVLLKATAGGEGSGLRMTQSEINNTLGGRTKWESLDATLRRWSSTPQKETIPEDQRAAMRKVATSVRDKMYKMHSKIMGARHSVDAEDDVKAINNHRTSLHDELFPAESELNAPETDASLEARKAALLKKAGR